MQQWSNNQIYFPPVCNLSVTTMCNDDIRIHIRLQIVGKLFKWVSSSLWVSANPAPAPTTTFPLYTEFCLPHLIGHLYVLLQNIKTATIQWITVHQRGQMKQSCVSSCVQLYHTTPPHCCACEQRHKEKQQWAESSGRLLRSSSGWVQTNKEEAGLSFCEDSLPAQEAADIEVCCLHLRPCATVTECRHK